MKNHDDAHAARRRLVRRGRLDLARRLTHWLPSPWVLLMLAGLAVAVLANVRVTAVP